LVLTQLVVF